ncbi:1-deoxy-D-xylulose-5-phosphate synthase [Andreesenia angusta]|uniref:1-deoxy-D-xylulose-5-phosphate synthase n=1 Tax=Andreesenia angusta TaxID=39480 RepID=UPI001B80A93A|nr:1-deoxy-D-xylulose-5-phosphate synthase [Andreesenia angusta]
MIELKRLSDYRDIQDIKSMKFSELDEFAEEIRQFLIESISKTGGHLASNLGVVELTLALHKVYNSGKDKIVWDVGHQAYVHKILTGRKDEFPTLRQYRGLSGFPKRKESPHDVFDTGHSSTSISAGLGYAMSRDILAENYQVISVIGDGAMTAGMAFEALNHAGDKKTDFTVVLNDNEMSISENVGGLSRYLYKVRTEKVYQKVKEDMETIVGNIPGIGKMMLKTAEKAKDSVKYFFVPGMFFEELGFKYFGPIDGHDIESLAEVFEKAKHVKGPKLIHVVTKKGKGYAPAEQNPEKFHGVSPFDIETGKSLSKSSKTYSDVLGETILDMGEERQNIVAITAAMPSGTGLDKFKDRFPERFFDVGIAEQHGVTLAAGMAANGLKPFFAVYSTFLQRAYDQVIHDVCIQNLPVVFGIDRAGLVGNDGETHHGSFDISYLSHMPNMTIISPKGEKEFKSMIAFGAEFEAPLAIRYGKGVCCDFVDYGEYPEKDIEYGVSETIVQGEEVAIIAVGRMVEVGYKVAKRLELEGRNITLVNARFIKPVDLEMVENISRTHRAIVTIEDNSIVGGFGSMVNTELLKLRYSGEVVNLGIKDEFIEHGDNEDLYRELGLDEDSVYRLIDKSFFKE